MYKLAVAKVAQFFIIVGITHTYVVGFGPDVIQSITLFDETLISTSMDAKDYYAVLGVDRFASPEVIKKSFLQLGEPQYSQMQLQSDA